MMPIFVLLLACLLVLAWLFVAGPALKARRYRAVMARPFPREWESLLIRQVSLYRRLPPDLKGRLHGLIHVFLQEKRFEGCDGLEVTQEMKLVVAAQACVPVLARRPPPYPGLISVLVYPTEYVGPQVRPVGGPAFLEEEEARTGESWKGGEVVLSWDEADQDSRMADGSNVVLHEFAHQMDQEGGQADGMPPLGGAADRAWREVFGRALVELRLAGSRGRQTAIDPYGAQNEAEFFACAVEAFFEAPGRLEDEQPELYDVMTRYFMLDPARWP